MLHDIVVLQYHCFMTLCGRVMLISVGNTELVATATVIAGVQEVMMRSCIVLIDTFVNEVLMHDQLSQVHPIVTVL